MKFVKLLTAMPILALTTACSSFQIHPFEVGVTLPYSENCRFKNVVTKQIREIDPVQCDALKKRSLILTSEAWRVIRTDIENNCAQDECVELRGKIDDLFLVIDKGLNELP